MLVLVLVFQNIQTSGKEMFIGHYLLFFFIFENFMSFINLLMVKWESKFFAKIYRRYVLNL